MIFSFILLINPSVSAFESTSIKLLKTFADLSQYFPQEREAEFEESLAKGDEPVVSVSLEP